MSLNLAPESVNVYFVIGEGIRGGQVHRAQVMARAMRTSLGVMSQA